MKLVFRFIFKPLVDELPGFGAITYSIRKQACEIYSASLRFLMPRLLSISPVFSHVQSVLIFSMQGTPL